MGIPFVAIGLYIVAGRFFVNAKQRERTFYALTNERILIISGLLNRKIKSINLRTLSDLSLSEGNGTEGTISFGDSSPFASLTAGFSSWPDMGQLIGPTFELIPNAKTVFETIRNAQRTAA